MLLARTSSCSIAAGRRTSVETSSGRWPSRRTNGASLPAVVVLPDPCRPASTMTVGGDGAYVIGVRSPSRWTISSSTIFTICWPGFRLSITSAPTARVRMLATKSLTTSWLPPASSRASRTSRRPASTSASLSLPRPVSFLSAWSRRSVRDSNTLRPLQPELALVVVEVHGRPPHYVVDGRPRHPLTLGDLAIGPMGLRGEMDNAPLVLGQQGAIKIEQAQLAVATPDTVKHLALTVYELASPLFVPQDELQQPENPDHCGTEGQQPDGANDDRENQERQTGSSSSDRSTRWFCRIRRRSGA